MILLSRILNPDTALCPPPAVGTPNVIDQKVEDFCDIWMARVIYGLEVI